MIADLTEYLRALGPGGEPPDGTYYEAARELLRAELVRAMMQRGLWNVPPSYLGVAGNSCWTRDLLDELVSDCYVELFLRRLPALKNQLLVREDVGGVIVRCVRNFLHDRQRDNDPLGYRIYELLRDSLARLHEAGKLWIDGVSRLAGQPAGRVRMHNGTLCSFVPEASSGATDLVDLQAQVRIWNDDLWPELITAQGRARTGVRERLDAHIARLGELGVEAFCLKDLVEPMKKDVRRRWSEELNVLSEEMISGSGAEDGHAFRELRDCVLRKLEREAPGEWEETRKLWLFLWTYAAGLNLSEVVAKAERGGRAPANLGLAEELDIARHRVPALKKTLGRLILACQAAASRKAPVRDSGRELSDGRQTTTGLIDAHWQGLHHMRPTDRDERLRDATGQAAARWADGRGEVEHDPRAARPGDTFALANSGDLLVEWVVVEEDSASARLLLVAVDDQSEVGSCDVPIGAGRADGLASVRCAVAMWLDVGTLDLRWRTGELPADVFSQVRRLCAALGESNLAEGTLTGSLCQREVDEAPRYQLWMKELGEVRSSLEASLGNTAPVSASNALETRRPSRRPSARRRLPYALAASILLTLGLGSTTVYQHYRLASLETELRGTPHPNLPVIWFTDDAVVRGADDPLAVSSQARRLALVVEVTSAKSYPRYRVEVKEAEHGEEVWASEELVESGSELSFDLPRSLLATGGYELRVYGLSAVARPSPEAGPDLVAELLRHDSFWITLD